MSDQASDDGQRPNDNYSDEEAARRRDAVIKRMLNTPPQPRRKKSTPPIPKAKERPASKERVHKRKERTIAAGAVDPGAFFPRETS